ncbi:MAG: hypothetical protein H6618_08430 [Deltaproteobacteria bacterium]|nr:hypothetical protein [Deltaproteobacteria bacterium]
MINLLKYMLFAGILLSRPALSADADCFTFMEKSISDSSVESDALPFIAGPAWDSCGEVSDEEPPRSPCHVSNNHLSACVKNDHYILHKTEEKIPAPAAIAVTIQTDTDSFAHASTQTDPEVSLHISTESGTQTETELTDRITDELAAEKSPLELVMDKIAELIAKKTKDISDPETVIQHGYALLLTMGNFNSKAASVIATASWHTIKNIPWKVAGKTAQYAAQHAALVPTMKLSEDSATKAVWSCSASVIISRVKLRLKKKRIYGNFASQSSESEEETLAYLSNDEHINLIFNVLFDTALSAVKDEESIHSASSVFRSQEIWNKFKETHFGKLTDEAKIYLIPWLSQLDKLVDMSS